MKLVDIKESGSNNTLRWAISKGAVIKEENELAYIINNELCYLVTLADLDFLEVFRLTQTYREKLRILESKTAQLPNPERLNEIFGGSITPDPNKPDETIPVVSIVEHAAQSFINLVLQMEIDKDIIQTSTPSLFIPMIASTYTVQIPVSFIDMVMSISIDEANRLFSLDYPGSIRGILEEEYHGFKHAVLIEMVKATSLIGYNDKYERYVSILKYSPLKKVQSDKLYSFTLTGFYRYDPISRGEVRCELFNSSQELINNTLKKLSWIKTPLRVEFAVQLPIYYMQILQNSLSNDDITITYESSIGDIVKSGLKFNDFISQEFYTGNNTEEVDDDRSIESYNNAISAYKVRITEANSITERAINDIINSNLDIDYTSAYALLPPIYTTKAIITVDATKSKELTGHPDPIISEMFKEMFDNVNSILSDIDDASKNK